MEGIKVLLVDDEKDFINVMIKRFRKRGINIEAKENGKDALEYLKKNKVDVVILDVKMPGMDGIQTLTEIKKIFPDVEVIMLTGHADMESAVEGIRLGAFDYLMKPTDIDELLFKIQDAFEKKKHEQKI